MPVVRGLSWWRSGIFKPNLCTSSIRTARSISGVSKCERLENWKHWEKSKGGKTAAVVAATTTRLPSGYRYLRKMSTSTSPTLKITSPGVINFPGITASTTAAVLQHLTHNHENHHIFFNVEKNFHNHIVHYLLALYDFGASESILSEAYKREKSRQLSIPSYDPKIVDELETEKWEVWEKYLGQMDLYPAYLSFFKREVERHKGDWKAVVKKFAFGADHEVVKKYIFGQEEREYVDSACIEESSDMKRIRETIFIRLFAEFYHPLIHLGYGIEFGIMEVVCEALAEAAVHEAWVGGLLLPAEQASLPKKRTEIASKAATFRQLASELRNNPTIFGAPKWNEIKLRVLIQRAGKETAEVVSKYNVPPYIADIQHHTAKSISNAAFICGSSIRPEKAIRFDFFLMHSITCSIFLPVFINQSWIGNVVKARLVEWKIRYDLALYASVNCPELHLEEIRDYVPKEPREENQWLNTFSRTLKLEDKSVGHGVKVIRALVIGEKFCRGYEERDEEGIEFEIRGDMWSKLGSMVIDSLEAAGAASEPDWVRGAGFDESWSDISARKV